MLVDDIFSLLEHGMAIQTHLATRGQICLTCASSPYLCRHTAVGERELREALDLVGTTTGKGKVTLRPNQRPLEVPSNTVNTTTGGGV